MEEVIFERGPKGEREGRSCADSRCGGGVGDIPAEGTMGAKALWLRAWVGIRVSVKRVEGDEARGHRGPWPVEEFGFQLAPWESWEDINRGKMRSDF